MSLSVPGSALLVRVDREVKESHVNKHKVLITLMLDFLIVNIFFYFI